MRVTNNESGRDEEVDLMGMIKNGDVAQDIYLRSGDTIYVPPVQSDAQISDKDFLLMASSSVAPPDFPVKVVGYVTKPGIYSLKSTSPSLNAAIASAEGYTPESNRKVVTVERTTPQGNISKMFIDPNKNDIVLRPNDLVIVSDKSTASAARGLTLLSTVLSPVAIIGSGINSWIEVFDPNRYNYRP